MDQKLEQILNELPTQSSRSRLEPYRELILRLRRDGRSFDAIRRILEDRCSVHISNNALLEFVHRRSRPRKAPDTAPQKPDPTYQKPVACEEQPRPTPRWTQEEIEAMRAKARASAHKPTTEPRRPPVFHYDPTRPLTNRAPDDKETNR